MSEQAAISAAVEKRLEGLDEFFMAALDGFAQAAAQQSEPEFAGARPWTCLFPGTLKALNPCNRGTATALQGSQCCLHPGHA